MEKSLQGIIAAADPVILEAATFIRKEAGKVRPEQIEHKALNDLVSYVDKAAEEIIVRGLRPILPEATFLTEEQTVEQSQGEWTWVIDPLDGTTNFLHQIPFFGVSVALMHQEEVVCGWVHDVMHDGLFHAWKGGGAYRNGLPIKVSLQDDFSQSLLVTGFPRGHKDSLRPYVDTFFHLMTSTRGVRRIGSAAVDLAYVACGRTDAFYEFNLKVWDVAAGVLLVREAGGEVSDFNGGGNFLFGGQILATNGRITGELRSCIAEGW